MKAKQISVATGSPVSRASAGRESLIAALEYGVGALRSNQDVLLHKVERTQVVREQLEINRTAIGLFKDALKEAGVDVN